MCNSDNDFFYKFFSLFLPVDSLSRLTLRQSLALLSPPENCTSKSLTYKDKGCLDRRLHSDTQVGIRAKKHEVYQVVSVLETGYLARVLGILYIG